MFFLGAVPLLCSYYGCLQELRDELGGMKENWSRFRTEMGGLQERLFAEMQQSALPLLQAIQQKGML